MEGKKPNRTWLVRIGFRFGRVQKLGKNNFGLITYFGPNRTEPKMFTPSVNPQIFKAKKIKIKINYILVLKMTKWPLGFIGLINMFYALNKKI